MSRNKTPNLKMHSWVGSDVVDFNELNENFNKIDTEIDKVTAQLADTAKQLKSNFSSRLGMLKRNTRGFYAIHNVGDSISQGSAAYNAEDDSWVGILRKAIQLELDTNNYGSINFYGVNGTVDIMRSFSTNATTGWSFANSSVSHGRALSFISLKTSIANATTTGYFRSANTYKFKKILIEVAKNSNAGEVQVKINGTLITTINCRSDNPATEMITVDTAGFGFLNYIQFINVSGTNEILNIYYMNDLDKVVFNNYANSGERLTGLTDERIDGIFDCSFLFFSLGHNTVTDAEMDRIFGKCKTAFNKHKPLMVVNDFSWNTARSNVSAKLKKFAEETNSAYVKIIEPVENTQSLINSGFLVDASHPTESGHNVIADTILAAIHTTFQSKKSIEYVANMKKGNEQISDLYENGVIVLSGRLDQSDPNYALFKDVKFSIEFKYKEGSPQLSEGLFIGVAEDLSGLRLYQARNIYSISNNLPITKGDYEYTAPSYTTVKYDAKYSVGADIDLDKIGSGKHCKIINGVVTNFTTKKTNLRDMLLYK